ncbi:hypothetical protein B0T26DRAFT_679493 [Lasiosphaeria miniovina]|uniref:Stress-response A/B barrel domain-containing protein n=1 Tax=Lasiosphaeria miniovina TaxID=1954250 RepID=A0AA40A6R3_9PEZI|nr:uncharacterized protein B0T26DRAFT_679493 [Lasiosphaeria miniovina]KAK0710188.1 hypothetical protein B0T26DRAFT_679493 [Lasiosphaeria miniovina]
MVLTHIVLIQFKSDAKPEDVKRTCAAFIALKDACLHPTSSTPYILSLKGGVDTSIAKLQDGITHGFTMEFASAEDRDYYTATDPSHQAFAKLAYPFLDKVLVVDFTDALF